MSIKKTHNHGLTALMMTASLLGGCADSRIETVPKYSNAKIEAIIKDERSCGPAAKQALYDYEVILEGHK